MAVIQIALAVLCIAGIWAVVELALTLRASRSAVDGLDKTVEELSETIAEVRPLVSKVDGVIDDLQPALAQVEPLLRQGSSAVEALSADLVEVNGVLRDISQITGTVSSASDAMSGLAGAASEKVHKLFSRRRPAERVEALGDADVEAVSSEQPASGLHFHSDEEVEEPSDQYFTYGDDSEASHE